ncbi:peptidase S8 [Mesobacillus foraminis]|uniref:S8 family peptidase n=1 Tax=Mesobacillus foraminis TaxID=279826 RepID=UPI001BE5B2E9|nr:S8 family peptidase [Mesobacillus foraminis]MBT2756780.1 peptidase S8 [Mesobacillus foraminis]
MFFWLGISAAVVAVLALFIALEKLSPTPSPESYVENQLIVKFLEDTTDEQIEEIHRKMKCTVIDENRELGLHVVQSKRKVQRMIKSFNKFKEIDYVEPNYIYKASYTPNDTYFPYQYGPQKIQAPAAWDVTQSDRSVKIAIVDTGVQLNHPDLANKLLAGYDFVNQDNVPDDGNGHGTHVAGIAAAVTNNSRGIAGVAPLASIMPVRVLDNSGSGTLSNIANGIIFAANQGAHVINLSLGSTQGAITLQNAIDYAWNKGAVLVAAAGNSGVNTPNYPAYYNNVIAVASTDPDDRKSPFSNYGRWVEVAAPGTDILSTYTGSYYAYLSGTSMASPHVAGLAALLADQGKTNTQIRNVIQNTSDPIPGTGTYWTYGRVNASRAVQS